MRGLPGDATPRVLWAYPQDAFGVSGRIVASSFSDGLLWVGAVGDGYQAVSIAPVGTAHSRSRITHREGPFGPMIVAAGHRVEWIGSEVYVDGAAVPMPVVLRNVEIVGTSHGFFFFAEESGQLVHFCFEDTGFTVVHWTMGGFPAGPKGPAFVLADDSIWMRGVPTSRGRAVHIDVDGNVLDYASTPSGEPAVGMDFAGELELLHPLFSPELVTVHDNVELARTPVAGPYRITPTGSVWTRDADGMHWTRWDLGVAVAHTPADRSVDLGATYAFPIGEDGSFLLPGGSRAAPTLLRMRSDGTVAWELPLPSPFTFITHDVDGRVYLYGDGAIMAVQTDVLPPAVRGCWQHRCSPAGDLRIE